VLLAAVGAAGVPWLTTLALAAGGAGYATLVTWREKLI
jgi:hypothetical protein